MYKWTKDVIETAYEQRQFDMLDPPITKGSLFIIRGAPGSGKSTFAEQLVEAGYADVSFEADQFRMIGGEYVFKPEDTKACHEKCQASVKEALDDGLTVAVANTFTKLWELQPYLKMGAKEVKVYSLRYAYQNVHKVPPAVVERMRNSYEPFEGERVYE